ncbi:flavodoxin domain-containing protein [Geodermatophilus sabuli]|uniref:Menaquinone-dependent protoporphyrinogen oxidase n=1 Tax=Geodermatophilus sabuli TaxID=1564158 RepID=A0A285EB14_9ACTN|nr:flavodoxin domain-containing protein [Geodermatophilus sabuli]MBB3084430.1 menaquinone-dependent protoporphyrinogen oxidase [Geodermatophilus sabuli]SNX96302.1 menaquinone-dependent protoporphyrinogen oxidase [Geodermatophilus sabuli]
MTKSVRVLVGYATAAGSTQGIAERIAAGLADVADVAVRPLGPDVDPAGFDAFVIGSAVHDQAWLPAALDFLRRGRTTVGDRPLWCFSVAGAAPRGPISRAVVGMEVQRIEAAFPSGLSPRGHLVFAGIVAMAGLPLWGRVFWRAIGGRPGDHRDWPAIDRWAGEIAAALGESRRDRTGSPAAR